MQRQLELINFIIQGADSGGGVPAPPLKKKKRERERGGEGRGRKEETKRSIKKKTSAEKFVISF